MCVSAVAVYFIISSCSLLFLQVDLIDMRHRPDGPYHWIGHYMDHWSKMHVLFPLMQKCANEVALNLSTKVFAYYGLPKILQSDNGREFVNAIVHKLVEEWPGEVTVINGILDLHIDNRLQPWPR